MRDFETVTISSPVNGIVVFNSEDTTNTVSSRSDTIYQDGYDIDDIYFLRIVLTDGYQ